MVDKKDENSQVKIDSVRSNTPIDSPQADSKKIYIFIALIIGVFLISIGSFSIYGYITSGKVLDIDNLHKENIEGNLDNKEGYLYNGFSFIKADGLWWTEIKRHDTLVKIPLHFGPKDVEKIPIFGELTDGFEQGDVYVAIDPDVQDKFYTLSLTELSFNIAKGINRQPVAACTKNTTDCFDRPIRSCNDSKGDSVIEIKVDPEAKIEFNGNCIKVQGQEYELTKAVNRLLYNWYGIMQ